jgi:protein TonB
MNRFLILLVILFFTHKIKAQNITTQQPDQDQLFTTNIDTAPEYKGGMDEFYSRLGHIPYTFYDRMTNHQGPVTIILVIEKDGSISNLKILHGISEKQDKEILRVVKRLNKWTPGIRDGKPVRVLCSIPIDFKIKVATW